MSRPPNVAAAPVALLTAVMAFADFFPHYLDPLRAKLPRDAMFLDAYQAKDWKKLQAEISSGRVSTLILIGYGSGGGPQTEKPLSQMRVALVAWVRAGGTLLMHGERTAATSLQDWFGLSHWKMEGDFYRRCEHLLNHAHPLLPQLAAGADPLASRLEDRMSVKACMLTGPTATERVYATGADAVTESPVSFMSGVPVNPFMCAVALTQLERGHVAFFGDVNAEAPTIKTMLRMVAQLQRPVAAAAAVAGAGAQAAGSAPASSGPPGGLAVVESAASASAPAPAAAAAGHRLLCSGCARNLPSDLFSANQRRKADLRRCQDCVAAASAVRSRGGQAAAAAAANAPSRPVNRVEHKDEDDDDDDDYDEDEGEDDEDEDEDVYAFEGDHCAFDAEFAISPRSESAGLLNAINYPVWSHVTDENDPSLVYYTDPFSRGGGGRFSPKRHWTFLAEITDSSLVGMGIGRNRLALKDRSGEETSVCFYTDRDELNNRPLFHSEGTVIAVRYAENHAFMDGSNGMRIEALQFVKHIPCSLRKLYQEYKLYAALSSARPNCAKCGAQPGTLAAAAGAGAGAAGASSSSSPVSVSRCAACHRSAYCSRACQQAHWAVHKAQCKIFQHLADLLAVEGIPFIKHVEFKMQNLKR